MPFYSLSQRITKKLPHTTRTHSDTCSLLPRVTLGAWRIHLAMILGW